MMKRSTAVAAAMLLTASCTHSEVKPANTVGANPPANGVLSGTVLEPDGTPAANATVVLIAEGHWAGRHDYAHTDAAGKFSLQNVPQGEITLYAAEDFKAGAVKLDFPQSTAAATVRLKAPASVSVTLHSADGAPIAGGRVYVSARGYSAILPNFGAGATTFTGDHFDLPALPSGESVLHINVKAAGAAPDRAAHVPVNIEPGQHGNVTAELVPSTASISAIVLDAASGKAIEATALLLEADGTVEAIWHSEPTTRQAAFGGRTAGEHSILIEKAGYSTQRLSAEVPAGQDISAGTASLAVSDPAAVTRAAEEKAADEKAAADKAAAEAAEKLAKETISITSTSPEAVELFKLGFDWLHSWHEQQAREAWQKALALDPNFLLAQSYLFSSESGAEAMKKVSAAFEAGASLPEPERTELQANDAYKRGDSTKGDELLAKVAALAPGDWRAHVLIGGLAFGARNLEAANAEFQKAAALNPAAFSPHSRQAQIAAVKGDHDTEISEYKKAAAMRPDEAALQDDVADAYLDAGKLDDAVAALAVEEKMPTAGWEAHSSMASVLILRGDLAGGVKEFEKARELSKDDYTRDMLDDSIAFAQLTGKKYADALKTLSAAEKEVKGKNPNYYVFAAIYRAMVLLDEGKHAAAVASMKEAFERIEKEPLSGTGRTALRRFALEISAWVNASAGKAADAQADADALAKEAGAAAATDRDLASTIAFAQGEALLAKGDGAGAAEAMAKCVPENDLCRWALSNAQEKAGDKRGAAATREALLALNHAGDLALWVRSRIAPAPPAKNKKMKPAAPK